MNTLTDSAEYLRCQISAAVTAGDVTSIVVLSAAHRLLLDGLRARDGAAQFAARPERRTCNFEAQLRCGGHKITCRIVDLSRRGMGLHVVTLAPIAVGEHVTVAVDAVGVVRGVLRWKKHQRLGVEIEIDGESERRIRRAFEMISSGFV